MSRYGNMTIGEGQTLCIKCGVTTATGGDYCADHDPHGNEMLQGYRDGFNRDAPEPSDNRSHSYRHGFRNGRADLHRKPYATPDQVREMAENALAADRDNDR